MALDTVVNRDPSIGIIQMLPWGGMSLGRHKLRVLVGRLLAASTGLIKKLLFCNKFRQTTLRTPQCNKRARYAVAFLWAAGASYGARHHRRALHRYDRHRPHTGIDGTTTHQQTWLDCE
jgi:hypothetical protein